MRRVKKELDAMFMRRALGSLSTCHPAGGRRVRERDDDIVIIFPLTLLFFFLFFSIRDFFVLPFPIFGLSFFVPPRFLFSFLNPPLLLSLFKICALCERSQIVFTTISRNTRCSMVLHHKSITDESQMIG